MAPDSGGTIPEMVLNSVVLRHRWPDDRDEFPGADAYVTRSAPAPRRNLRRWLDLKHGDPSSVFPRYA